MPKSIPCTVCWTMLRLHCLFCLCHSDGTRGVPTPGARGTACPCFILLLLVTEHTCNRGLGADTQSLSRAQMEHCATPPLQEWGGREGRRWTPFSLFPSLLQHCIWAKLKSICIWEGMCAVVGVTSKKDGRVPYVLLHCRFYSFLEICSKILLISCPKNLVVFCTLSVL